MAAASVLVPPGGRNADTASRLIGQTLRGTYRILDVLDQGGMGVVFLAEHVRLHRRVAVKVLAGHLSDVPRAQARFEREAEVISRLEHPHIVNVLDFDWTDAGELYLVMELLQGESLEERLEREGVLPADEAVTVARQVADGLTAAHRASVVHRDLKPANVFLVYMDEQGAFVKLLDFGISKVSTAGTHLTGQHAVIGTPEYMSPEQASGRTAFVDHRGDQFSLAVITFEMLTGQLPFTGDTLTSLLQSVVYDEPQSLADVAPHLPPGLDPVLRRALAKDPADRYVDVGEFAAELADAVGQRHSTVNGLRTHSTRLPAAPRDASGARRPTAPTGLDESSTCYRFSDGEQVEVAYVAPGPSERPSRPAPGRVNDAVAGELARLRRGGDATALDRCLLVDAAAMSDCSLSAQEAFLISRIDHDVTVETLLDLSPLGREESLRLLERLARRGLLRFKP